MKSDSIARFIGIMLVALVIVTLALVAWFGTPQQSINTTYGVRYGRDAKSVNGTSVLAEMFSEAGATIHSGRRLSPKLARSQVIVWAPNSFELPSDKEIDFLEQNWLGLDDYQERTLVYVARDYDAAIDYWRKQANQGDDEDFVENTRRKARAQAEHAYMRSLTSLATKCRWFSIDNQQHFFETRPNSGPWYRQIKSTRVKMWTTLSLVSLNHPLRTRTKNTA